MLNRQFGRQLFLRNMQVALLLIPALIFFTPEASAGASKRLCSASHINSLLERGRLNPRSTNVDPQLFYKEVKKKKRLFRFRSMKAGSFGGIDDLLEFWNANTQFTDNRWLAYMLATTYHETAGTMRPIREYGKGRGRRYGKPHRQTKKTYYGRGYVQLTWAFNYKNADKQLGHLKLPKSKQLYWTPSLAMTYPIARKVLYTGMREGWFASGHCLPRRFRPNRKGDWKNARRMINGLDKWNLIKNEALDFLAVIKKSQVPVETGKQIADLLKPIKPAPTTDPAVPSSPSDKPKIPGNVKEPAPDLLRLAKQMEAIYRRKTKAHNKYVATLTGELNKAREDLNKVRNDNRTLKLKIDQLSKTPPPVTPPSKPVPPSGTDPALRQAVATLVESNSSLLAKIKEDQTGQNAERRTLLTINNKVLQQTENSSKTLGRIETLLTPPARPADKTKGEESNTPWYKNLWIK